MNNNPSHLGVAIAWQENKFNIQCCKGSLIFRILKKFLPDFRFFFIDKISKDTIKQLKI